MAIRAMEIRVDIIPMKSHSLQGDVVGLQEDVAAEEQEVALSLVLQQQDVAVEEEECVLSQEDVALEEEEYVLSLEDAVVEEEYVLSQEDAALEEEKYVLKLVDVAVEEEYVLSHVEDFSEGSGDLGDHPVEDVKGIFFELLHELWLGEPCRRSLWILWMRATMLKNKVLFVHIFFYSAFL